jgi:hypothetical protein
MLRVWETLRLRPDEHQLTYLRGIAEGKAESNVATVRTGYESGLRYLAIEKQLGNIVGFVIGLLRSGRTAIAAPVLTKGMELFVEGRPYVVPDR